MKTLSFINFGLAAVFAACCFYQLVYLVVRLLGKRRVFRAQKLCQYAVLIAARNEEAVIGQLLDSIHAQDYPADLFDVYVVADNCTDKTAAVAAEHGAYVFERQDRLRVGKGYALSFLLGKIKETGKAYDGYFVFDADNLLDQHYISEMNKVFSNGWRVVTGYRNTKNFADNWVTAGYGLYFLRESEYLNRPRDVLGVSCSVSGTGFLFADSLLQELGGWNYFLLTEDLEFTADLMTRGERIAYCGDAVLYDEQPASFKTSIAQRSRWIKGYFQVLGKHGWDLMRTLAATGRFACYDMLMNAIPSALLTLLSVAVNTVMLIVGLCTARQEMGLFFFSVGSALFNSYGLLFLFGALTMLTEGKRILCPRRKRFLYCLTFPFFIFTFIAAMLSAVFSPAEWKPIRHTVALSIGELNSPRK